MGNDMSTAHRDAACDVVFKNAQIVDGTGAPSFIADIGIKGDKIVFVNRNVNQVKKYEDFEEIDCEGQVVCPGFIDIHNHSDFAIFSNPDAMNCVTQGVSTLVVGNCGTSAAPTSGADLHMRLDDLGIRPKTVGEDELYSFSDYLSDLEKLPKAINVASLVGHGQIRNCVVGLEKRAASSDEISRMKDHVKEAMEAGAFGLSTGLIYSPGMYATTGEIAELAKVVSDYDGLYASHLRSESDRILHALLECIDIAEKSGCRAQVSHLKASGRRNWGMVSTAIETMEYARRLGVEVTYDAYPFAPSGASLFVLFPDWTRSGGKAALQEKIRDSEVRKAIEKQLARPSPEWENIYLDAGPEGLLITASSKYPQYVGKTLADVAALRNENPIDTLFSLAEDDIDISMIAEGMSEEDNKIAITHRLGMISSDSTVVKLGEKMPHPRTYCAFSKVLSDFVRDESLLSLEEAVYKMSGFPAWKLGLYDRGVIKPGAKADIVVLDIWKMRCESRFGDPHHYTEGITHFMVNGKLVIRDNKTTGAMPGAVLLKTGC